MRIIFKIFENNCYWINKILFMQGLPKHWIGKALNNNTFGRAISNPPILYLQCLWTVSHNSDIYATVQLTGALVYANGINTKR